MTRGDRILVSLLALAALLSWPAVRLATAATAEVVEVTGPGGTTEVRLGATRMLEVEGLHGVVTVALDESGARVVSSSCPDKLCVKQGRAGAGGSIVCAPNGVSVRVGGGDDALDAVVR